MVCFTHFRMNKFLIFCLSGLLIILPAYVAFAQRNDEGLPSWTKSVGTRSEPLKQRIFSANAYGAKPDGTTNPTRAVQQAIDECSNKGGGVVAFNKGEYVTGAIFLKNNVHFR